MSTSATLPVGPFEHVSMDYARLREEALRLLAKLGSEQWTDFNAHDPGITILEQLCYAITDLGYRTDFPIAELLGPTTLPAAQDILTTDPVAASDLRRLALDGEGVDNAWVEALETPEVPFYFHPSSSEIRLQPDLADPESSPGQLKGIARVVLRAAEQVASEDAARALATRLHAARSLGSDFQVSLARTFAIDVNAQIEVDGTVDDPAGLLAEILGQIDDYFAPKPSFISLPDARAQGLSSDELMEGPVLARGFATDLPDPRRTVYVSDLLHAILNLPAVKAVSALTLGTGGSQECWAVAVPAGQMPARGSCEIKLMRGSLELRADADVVLKRLAEGARARSASSLAGAASSPAPAPRDLLSYHSIQYQMPAVYGVGPLGLAPSAGPERLAQARQLAAYLLIFDQLFANALAQLAHAAQLLSPEQAWSRTYAAAAVEDERLGFDGLRVQTTDEHRSWLDDAVESEPSFERQKRFSAHLLARYAEEPAVHSLLQPAGGTGAAPQSAETAMLADRRSFLLSYPQVSRSRGSGFNVESDSALPDGGFAARLRQKLGLADDARLHVVEHVLLRPVAEDLAQLAAEGEAQVPLLDAVTSADPWSLHVTIVLDGPVPADPVFEQFVAQTILAETPAHLTPHLLWLGDDGGVAHASAFAEAWRSFRAACRLYRAARLSSPDESPVAGEVQLNMRATRDRVIDLLGFGRTYPLRDIPVSDQVIVVSGTRGKILLSYSQPHVVYELCDRVTGNPVLDGGKPIKAEGTGAPLELVTPVIHSDVSYRIRATKIEDEPTGKPPRSAWLRGAVFVIEGVDPSVVASILLPVLDPSVDNPKPSDARIGEWGVQAEVVIVDSQEGVTYELIEDAPDLSDFNQHKVVSKPVVGTSKDVKLVSFAITEDVDLRVRGRREVSGPKPAVRTGILDVTLPLRVRANPTLPAQVVQPVVDYAASAIVQVGASQASASYRLYSGRVRDRDFVIGVSSEPTIDVATGGSTVRLRRPAQSVPPQWQVQTGFVPAGDATAGDGSTCKLAIDRLTTDTYLIVWAEKRHKNGPLNSDAGFISSAVQLGAVGAVLVRPNPAPPLRLTLSVDAAATRGPILVEGGQPGVFYELRPAADAPAIARPAYFHQRDDENPLANKGLSQLRVETDFVLARNGSVPVDDRTTTPPPPPLLDAAPQKLPSQWIVAARKAMSGLSAQLSLPAVIPATPAVQVEPASVHAGDSADIVIAASRTDERYGLVAAETGAGIGEAVQGTGGSIRLATGALTARTALTVTVTRADPGSLSVERRWDLVIDVA